MSALLDLSNHLKDAGLNDDEITALLAKFLEEEAEDYLECMKLSKGNPLTALLEVYYAAYGLFIQSPYDKDDMFWINSKREIETPLEERQSGILDKIIKLQSYGFDFKEDCDEYLNNPEYDRLGSPLICVGTNFDPYMLEYLINNGYKELLDESTTPGYYSETVAETIVNSVYDLKKEATLSNNLDNSIVDDMLNRITELIDYR